MLRALLLAVAVFSLWPVLARAVDTSNFVLRTTEALCLVCSAADHDPLWPVAISRYLPLNNLGTSPECD